MTREEAIAFFKDMNECTYGNLEAVEMAIKALEQQPCEDKIIEWKKDFKEYVNSLSIPRDDYKGIMEYIDELPVAPQEPCKDAISRAEAVKVASGYCHPSNIAKELAKLPAVQPIRPKGYWKESNRDACPECSICGELQDYKSDFCPNCGAKMESEDKMHIVINLPDTNITEDIIRAAKWEDGSLFDMVLRGAMKNATILPKGHKVIDAFALQEHLALVPMEDRTYREAVEIIDRFPAITEADKERKVEIITRG